MTYGFKSLNNSEWMQISDTWTGCRAASVGEITTKNLLGNYIGASTFTLPSGVDYPQIYVRPNYSSWSSLNSALGSNSIYYAAIGSITNSGRTSAYMLSNTSISLYYLTYGSWHDVQPNPSSSGYGLEVYDASGNVQYSSTGYAPLPVEVLNFNTTTSSWVWYNMSSGDVPPWAMINNVKAIEVETDYEGEEPFSFTTTALLAWDCTNYRIGITQGGYPGGWLGQEILGWDEDIKVPILEATA